MSELIDRQAAIDFVDAGHLCNPNEPRWSDNEVVNFLKSRPPVQPEPHWMPVSERCPDKAGMYLITNYDGYVFLHYYDGEDSSKKFWKSYIKAWMPLPEPYKEEGEQDEQA